MLSPFVINMNPNNISLLAFLSAVVSGYFFWTNYLAYAAFFWGLNGFLDILDGEVAKKMKRVSKKGDFLDHTVDRLSDVFVFVGLAYNPLIPQDLVFVTLVCVILVSYLGTQAQAVTKERVYGGILGNADRHVILIFGALGAYIFSGALLYAIYSILILSFITFVQRFFAIYRKLD